MNTIYLIDGSSMLSTQFFGTLPMAYSIAKTEEAKKKAATQIMQTKDGLYTNGTFGMTKELMKLIREQNPSHLAVYWDISRETFRREIYAEYKAHRKVTAVELSTQFDTTQKMLSYIGVPNYSLKNYEADDLIGTVATEMSRNNRVVILTKDQDALQLINENTTVWLKTKGADKMANEAKELGMHVEEAMNNYFPFTAETFEHFYGIRPKQIIDLKALDGDKSDGIPGIVGYSNAKFIPLLQCFGDVETMYDYIKSNDEKTIVSFFKENGIKGVKKEKLMEYEEQVYMSKRLATIDCHIQEYKEKTEEHVKMNIDDEKMKKIFERLQFNSLMKD